jgi:hypothetical protein
MTVISGENFPYYPRKKPKARRPASDSFADIPAVEVEVGTRRVDAAYGGDGVVVCDAPFDQLRL